MNRKAALAVLGLDDNAGWQSVKARQRVLVKAHHPDAFTDHTEAANAHERMAEINRAVHHLKRLHNNGLFPLEDRKRATKSPPRAPKSATQDTAPGENPQEPAKAARSGKATKSAAITQQEFEAWVAKQRNRTVSRQQHDARFTAHRNRVLSRYRDSVQNTVFQHYFAQKTTALGQVSGSSIYERYVLFRKVQDALFYAINRPLNVILKYSGLLLTIVYMLRALLHHFYRGALVYQPELFWIKVWTAAGAFAVLTIPDVVFRWAVVFRFQDFNHPFYVLLMRRGTFPGRMAVSFFAFLWVKYGILVWLAMRAV
jgi:curved DNA-binding protein CbpA